MKTLRERIFETEKSFTIYIMCGLPGSGKSTWVKENLGDIAIVSRDITRSELGFTKNVDDKAKLSDEDEGKVTKVNNDKMDAYIKAKINFVVDDTNTSKYRKELINKLRKSNAKLVGVNIKTDIETCIRRRKDQIPEDVMRKIYKNMSLIEKSEVDELIEVIN